MTLQTSLGTARRLLEHPSDEPSGVHSLYLRTPARPQARDRLSEAVHQADVGAGEPRSDCDLAAVWQDVLEGRLTIYSEGAGPRGRYVLCRSVEGATLESLLSRVETAVLVRVLGGEQQKAVALELGMACSTASKWYTSALGKLHLDVGPIPMPLIVAAQAWAAGTSPAVGARRATVDYQGTEFVLVSLPCADAQREPLLTPAEREVAQLLIEGRSRWEIAAHRSTSSQTVACQLRGIFGKLRVSGRCSLIKRAVGTGWFRG